MQSSIQDISIQNLRFRFTLIIQYDGLYKNHDCVSRVKIIFYSVPQLKKSHYVVEPVIKGPRWYIATFQYFDTTHFFLDKLISFPTICHAVCKRRWVLYIKRKVFGEPCRCFWPFYQFLSSRHLLRRDFAYIEHCFSRLCYTEPP